MHRSDSKPHAVWTRNERFCIDANRKGAHMTTTQYAHTTDKDNTDYDTFPIDKNQNVHYQHYRRTHAQMCVPPVPEHHHMDAMRMA